MRKTIPFMIFLLLLLGLLAAACTPPTPSADVPDVEEPEEQAAEVPAESEEEQAPAGDEAAEEVTLTWLILEFWNPDNVIAAYKELYPNITIEAEKVGFADLFQQNQIRLAAGDGSPDIVSVDVPLVASYGARGWLYPLDEAFSAEDLQSWVPGALEAGSYNDQFLAVPQHTSTQLLYYNKALFDAAGITPPGEDERWTWEQVADAASQLTNGDVYGFNWEQTTEVYQLQPLPVSLGGEMIGEDGYTVEGVINSPEWVQALTFYSDAFNAAGYAPKSEMPVVDMFLAGKLAMFVGGNWNNLVFTWGPPEFEWGVSRFPYFEGGETVLPTGSWHFGVNASSPHAEAAAEFLRWMSAGEGAEIWWGVDSYDMPAQTRIIESFYTLPEFQEPPLYYMQVAADESVVNPIPRPVTPGYLEYQQLLAAAFDDIRNGADVHEALDTAAERITAEMQKYQQ